MQNENIDSILKKAAAKEKGTYLLYKKAAERVKDAYTKSVLQNFADEELKHKEVIENFKTETLGKIEINMNEVSRQGVSEFLTDADIELKQDPEIRDVLIFAAKREKKAFAFYDNLSKLVEEEDLKKLFSWLAQEESKHKEDIEALFWEVMYR